MHMVSQIMQSSILLAFPEDDIFLVLELMCELTVWYKFV